MSAMSRDTGHCCDRRVGSESFGQMSAETRWERRTQRCAEKLGWKNRVGEGRGGKEGEPEG